MPTLCLPVVCSLPARGYSQLFLLSRRCGLTTPPSMQVLPIKRPNSCGICARYCDALCAAMMTQFLLELCAHFGSAFRHLRETVCASWTSWCSDTRGLYVQKWCGWVLGYARLSFERRGVVPRFTDIGVHRPAGCRLRWLLLNRVQRPVQDEWQCETRLRFKLRGLSAPPCAQCCPRTRVRCARLSIPAATRVRS